MRNRIAFLIAVAILALSGAALASTLTTGTITTKHIAGNYWIENATTEAGVGNTTDTLTYTFTPPDTNRGQPQPVEVIGIRVQSSAVNVSDMTITLNANPSSSFDNLLTTVDLGTTTDQVVLSDASRLILRSDSDVNDALDIACTNTSETFLTIGVLFEVLK